MCGTEFGLDQRRSGLELRSFLLRDSRENRKKCTLTPLEGRPELRFGVVPPARVGAPPVALPCGILLAVDAPELTPGDRTLLGANGELVLLDATWFRLEKMLPRLQWPAAGRLVRRSIPREVVTAYPRASKVRVDPTGGLASVEALYVASVILGAPRPEYLEGYRWRESFLVRNAAFLLCHGVGSATAASRPLVDRTPGLP